MQRYRSIEDDETLEYIVWAWASVVTGRRMLTGTRQKIKKKMPPLTGACTCGRHARTPGLAGALGFHDATATPTWYATTLLLDLSLVSSSSSLGPSDGPVHGRIYIALPPYVRVGVLV